MDIAATNEQPTEAGMATPSDQPSTAGTTTNQPPKMKRNPNRRERRAFMAMNKRQKRASEIASSSRLNDFQKLTIWKDKETTRKNRMTDEQIASVFRVALNRLFKGKEIVRKREKVTFDQQLTAIVRNVKKGFKYKTDVIPAATPTPAPTTTADAAPPTA